MKNKENNTGNILLGGSQIYSNSIKAYNGAEIKDYKKKDYYLNNEIDNTHEKAFKTDRPDLVSSLNIRPTNNIEFSDAKCNKIFKKIQQEKNSSK